MFSEEWFKKNRTKFGVCISFCLILTLVIFLFVFVKNVDLMRTNPCQLCHGGKNIKCFAVPETLTGFYGDGLNVSLPEENIDEE